MTAACLDRREQTCVLVCPVSCIHDAGPMFVIDARACIDCGACVTECPVHAIHPHDDLPDGGAPFVAVNAAYSAGLGAVRIQLEQLRIPLDGRVDPAYFPPSELAG